VATVWADLVGTWSEQVGTWATFPEGQVGVRDGFVVARGASVTAERVGSGERSLLPASGVAGARPQLGRERARSRHPARGSEAVHRRYTRPGLSYQDPAPVLVGVLPRCGEGPVLSVPRFGERGSVPPLSTPAQASCGSSGRELVPAKPLSSQGRRGSRPAAFRAPCGPASSSELGQHGWMPTARALVTAQPRCGPVQQGSRPMSYRRGR
jgi:hypothetical protein